MQAKHLFFLAALVVASTPCARADESDQGCPATAYRALSAFLGSVTLAPRGDGPNASGRVVASACKRWPYRPDTLLVALAYDAGVEDEKTVLVATLDKALRVTAFYREKVGEGVGQTYGPSSLSLDTARYDLAPGVRAFGLRFSSFGPGASAASSDHSDELTLFVPQGKTLRPVLTDSMRYQNALGGSELLGCPTAEEIIENGEKTIAIARSSTKGYADLIVTDSITYDTCGQDRPAGAIPLNRVEKSVLRYDGARYR